MYRPTVRMDNRYKQWIDDVADVTTLDRNQIMRLCLFVSGHSKHFKMLAENYLKDPSTSLPSPSWDAVEHGLWMNQTYERRVGETSGALDVNDFEIVDERGEKVVRKIVVNSNETGVIKWKLD